MCIRDRVRCAAETVRFRKSIQSSAMLWLMCRFTFRRYEFDSYQLFHSTVSYGQNNYARLSNPIRSTRFLVLVLYKSLIHNKKRLNEIRMYWVNAIKLYVEYFPQFVWKVTTYFAKRFYMISCICNDLHEFTLR